MESIIFLPAAIWSAGIADEGEISKLRMLHSDDSFK
jgi:hypothetical protein